MILAKKPSPTFREIIDSIVRRILYGRQRPEQAPKFREIIASIQTIVHGRQSEQKQRRGLSPGLLLMAIVALVITILAAVKNMK